MVLTVITVLLMMADLPAGGRDMVSGQSCKLFESPVMRQATGDTLRPGGFYLTDRAMQLCRVPAGVKVLDVGCGSGATVEYLQNVYRLQAMGIDPSESMLELGRQRKPDLPLLRAPGEDLPFNDDEMDGVLAECTLSLMTDLDRTLAEIHRVLKNDGWFAVNDVYAREPEGIAELRQIPAVTCLRGAMTRAELAEKLVAHGFEIVCWEDHTDLLKKLTVNLIMTHGSMARFWLRASSCTVDPQQAQRAMAKAKMGYFLSIARKRKAQ